MKKTRTSYRTTRSTRSARWIPVHRPIRGRKWQAMKGADVRQLTGLRRCTDPRGTWRTGPPAAYRPDGREAMAMATATPGRRTVHSLRALTPSSQERERSLTGPMRPTRALAAVLAGMLVLTACSSKTRTSTAPAALVDIGQGLQGPAGLHASFYVGGLAHASAVAFDARGRLWVATADYTDAGQDALYVVNGPGAAPVAAVTGLHTPLGLLWIDDSLYVSSKERVDAYSGWNGAAFASQRNVLTLPAGVGEVNGLVRAPDGRIQMGISAPCDHCTPTSPLSGAVVSFLPDGTDLRVEASRMRAPIQLAYFPG